MTRISTSRRGVSPVVSALLMVVITVAAFGVLYSATDSWIRAQRAGPLLRIRERLVVEDVWFRTRGALRDLISVYVRNIGEVSVDIKFARVSGGDIAEGHFPMTPETLTLTVGTGGQMNVTLSKVWTPGTTYKITLVTDRGSEITTHATA